MKTLEELALAKAVQDRSWLKNFPLFFKNLTSQIKDKFIQVCLEQNNVAAFQELLLNLQQDKLVIRHDPKFTEQFALVVANCIQNDQRWKETQIMAIDFRGCTVGKYLYVFNTLGNILRRPIPKNISVYIYNHSLFILPCFRRVA